MWRSIYEYGVGRNGGVRQGPGGPTLRRMRYAGRRRLFSRIGSGGDPEAAAAFRRLRHATLQSEREALIRLRDEGVIGDEVLHRLEYELDVEALRLGTGDLRG